MAKQRTAKKRPAKAPEAKGQPSREEGIKIATIKLGGGLVVTLQTALLRLRKLLADAPHLLKDVRLVSAEVAQDEDEAQKLMVSSDSQFARRTYVRTAFAGIEAMSCVCRRFARAMLFVKACKRWNLDLAALGLLSEETGVLGNTGKASLRPQQQPMLPHIAFTLRTAAELVEVDANRHFSDNGWNEFQKAIRLRHRLTHPKTSADLQVSDEDMRSFDQAEKWIADFLKEVIAGFQKHVQAIENLLRAIGDQLQTIEDELGVTGRPLCQNL